MRDRRADRSGQTHSCADDSYPGNRWPVVCCVCCLILVSIALRITHLSRACLWVDEGFSWRLASFPFPQLVARAAEDNNPPLYYVLLRAWMAAFGESVIALRMFSVLGGVLAVLGTYFLTRDALCDASADQRRQSAGPRETAIYAMGLVTFSGLHIHWARQARMYSLGLALVVWSTWALIAALRRPERAVPFWMLYSILSLAFLYTHTMAVVSVAFQVALIAGHVVTRYGASPALVASRADVRRAGLAVAAIACGWAPWIPILLHQQQQVAGGFWTRLPTIHSFAGTVYLMFADPRSSMVMHSSVPAAIGALATAVVCFGLFLLLRRPTLGKAALALLAAGPIMACTVISFLIVPVLHVRYLCFAQVFLLISAAALIGQGPTRPLRVLLFVLALTDMVWLSGTDFLLHAGDHPGERLVAEYLDAARSPDEPVVVCEAVPYFPLIYHSRHREGWLKFESTGRIVHYHGAAAFLESEIIDESRLARLDAPLIWTVGIEWDGLRRVVVPVPHEWKCVSERRFPIEHGPRGVRLVVGRYSSTAQARRRSRADKLARHPGDEVD